MIDEFSRIEAIKGQRATNVLTSAKTRRQAVAAALATCPPDEWVAVDDLFVRMRRGNLSPTVARSERALWKLYLVDPQYGSLGYSGYADWRILEGRYTLVVLFEYAATLGLIDVDYTDPAGARDDYHRNWGADDHEYLSRYDGLFALRLNALGAYVLGSSASYQRPADAGTPDRILKVLANLDIVATGPLPAADRLTLDAYGERTADHVWTVRAATLLAAIEGGRSPAQLLDFLGQRTTHDLPGTLTTLAADVTGRAAKVRDRGVVRLIECADAPLAALIAKDLRTRCALVGDRHLAVPVEDEHDFRKALRRLGYVPTRD